MTGRGLIVWGLSGGISVYKSLDIIHRLRKELWDVQVLMTENACKFVSPMTLEVLTGREVITDIFDKPLSHIDIADRAVIFIVAPATYNIIGKLAHGLADDCVTTVAAAIRSKKLIAPAMNSFMYGNRALQDNLSILRGYGYEVIEPSEGYLACGHEGLGRLRGGDDILLSIYAALGLGGGSGLSFLSGKRVLVTAGGTRESIDAVRYIGNWSSGKMGMAFVETCLAHGADTLLVHSYMDISVSSSVRTIFASSAKDMLDVLRGEIGTVDILIMAAAVGDYSPAVFFDGKLKKDEFSCIELSLNPDILRELSFVKGEGQVFVGFAAESDDIVRNAGSKLRAKGLDVILANDISRSDIGFGSDENKLTFITSVGVVEEFEKCSKEMLSILVLRKLGSLFFSD